MSARTQIAEAVPCSIRRTIRSLTEVHFCERSTPCRSRSGGHCSGNCSRDSTDPMRLRTLRMDYKKSYRIVARCNFRLQRAEVTVNFNGTNYSVLSLFRA